MNTLKLQEASIFQIPFRNYPNDFTFIVNNEEFHTNKLVADLLSPLIARQHLIDPTFSQFTINTQEKGNFQQILDLINFETQAIEDQSIPFISSIFDKLKIEKVEIKITENNTTIDNVFDHILKYECNKTFYFSNYQKEINFLSSNFFLIKEDEEKKIENFQLDTIEDILNNSNLQLESEDQLLRIVNRLYLKDSTFSKLYEYIDFINAELSTINEFVSIFDIYDITHDIWANLMKRFKQEIKPSKNQFSSRIKNKKIDQNQQNQEVKKGIEFKFNGKQFDGIFNYLRKNSNIHEEVNITKSSNGGGGDFFNLFVYENENGSLCTYSSLNEWICIELKKKKVIPTYYTVKTHGDGQNGYHARSWVIEGSNDNSNWEKIDEQQNCPYLNGSYLSHSFPIQNENQKEFKFIQMKLTGPNWRNDNYLCIIRFELFGNLNEAK